MYVIREIMYCKPGKVKPLVEKFHAMAKIGERTGMPKMRLMTDVAAERYWTIVAEMETESIDGFLAMDADADEETLKEYEKVMKGYHDLVDHGRREIYRIEG
jgi:hypothetical protein